MSNFIQVTPFMRVEDLERAVTFFTDILGFKALLRQGDYVYLHRETVGFRILEQEGEDGAPPGNRRFAYYIDVRDVDQLYAELKPKLDTLPKGDVYGPVNQSYGQRELLVLAPDGNLLRLGTPLAVRESRITDVSLPHPPVRRLSRNLRRLVSHHERRFSNGADGNGVPSAVPEVVDLLFLGQRDATITTALLAAFFSVTKNTARPKPGGTEPAATRTKPKAPRTLSSTRRARAGLGVGADVHA